MHGAGGGAVSGSGHPNFKHGARTNGLYDFRALVAQLQHSVV